MKKFAVLVTLLVLLCCQAALAATPDVFTAPQGSYFKAENWSLGVRPSRTVAVVIPAGHEAQLPRFGAESGDLLVAGRLVGPQGITVYGSVNVEPAGEIDVDEQIMVTGLGTINFGTEQPYYLRLQGWHRLTAPLTVREDLYVEAGATLNTQGFPVTVPRETYSFLESTLWMGASTWRTGKWFIYGPALQRLDAHEATLIVDRPVLGPVFGVSSYLCGCEWTYRNMTIEGYEPFAYRSFNVTGTLTLNRSAGGVRLEHGRIVTVGGLASDGTVAEPARVESDLPGLPYTVRLSGDSTVAGCLAVSDMHVEGGVLHDPCGTDEGGNSGVVF